MLAFGLNANDKLSLKEYNANPMTLNFDCDASRRSFRDKARIKYEMHMAAYVLVLIITTIIFFNFAASIGTWIRSYKCVDF